MLHIATHYTISTVRINRDGFEASMLEAKAKAKARPGRGQSKTKSAKTSDYRVLERELKAKVVFLMQWKFTLHNFCIKTINDITIWK